MNLINSITTRNGIHSFIYYYNSYFNSLATLVAAVVVAALTCVVECSICTASNTMVLLIRSEANKQPVRMDL